MCGQHNVRASAGENTGQNTDKGHSPNPKTEIKIPDPVGNWTQVAGLEGTDSTDHATAVDIFSILRIKINISVTNRTIHLYSLYFQNLEYAVLKSSNSDK